MYLASIAIRLVKSKRNCFLFRIALNALNAKGQRNWHVLFVMVAGLSSAKNAMGLDTPLLAQNSENRKPDSSLHSDAALSRRVE